MKLAGVIVGALILLQALAGCYVAAAQTTTATPIKHVIMIMMENHSFDNVFGLYPTSNKSTSNPLILSIQKPDDLIGVRPPSSLTAVPNGTFSTSNPEESVYVADWDNGKMDGFASNSGSQSMTYFGASQFAVEWDWAELYSVADAYFASCLCMTDANRLFSLAGYAAGLSADAGPPPYVPVGQSVMAELSHFGVSWAYYVDDPAVSNFPLNYFSGIENYSSKVQSWSDFYSAVAQGTLPAVTWVMPVGGTSPPVSQHPEENVTDGEQWLLGVVNRVMSSSLWNSSAIFITYDEGGGYYDHVPPPVVDGQQLGFRIPLFVISPYAKENYVSHTVMNHASQLAFVDYNWRMPALNSFVADSGLPLDMFDFGSPYPGGALARAPLPLNGGTSFPVRPQVPFSQLPYGGQGMSNSTLASLGAGVYVSNNVPFTPFYESVPFTAVVGVSLVVLLYLATRVAKNRRKAQTERKKTVGAA